jgi:hypothetical protein
VNSKISFLPTPTMAIDHALLKNLKSSPIDPQYQCARAQFRILSEYMVKASTQNSTEPSNDPACVYVKFHVVLTVKEEEKSPSMEECRRLFPSVLEFYPGSMFISTTPAKSGHRMHILGNDGEWKLWVPGSVIHHPGSDRVVLDEKAALWKCGHATWTTTPTPLEALAQVWRLE